MKRLGRKKRKNGNEESNLGRKIKKIVLLSYQRVIPPKSQKAKKIEDPRCPQDHLLQPNKKGYFTSNYTIKAKTSCSLGKLNVSHY